MKTHTILILLVFFGMVSTANAQFKHDIGLKIGNVPSERSELEYRWHKSDKWAFGISATHGSQATGYNYYSQQNDTIYSSIYSFFETRYLGGSLSAQRKLSFMKYNFYYVGAKISGGSILRNSSVRESTFLMDSSSVSFFPYGGDLISFDESNTRRTDFYAHTKLYLGADFPIVDRLSVNCELGMTFGVERWSANSHSLQLLVSANAGLRYRFGKKD